MLVAIVRRRWSRVMRGVPASIGVEAFGSMTAGRASGCRRSLSRTRSTRICAESLLVPARWRRCFQSFSAHVLAFLIANSLESGSLLVVLHIRANACKPGTWRPEAYVRSTRVGAITRIRVNCLTPAPARYREKTGALRSRIRKAYEGMWN